MTTINLARAKARLSELVAQAAAGEPVQITLRGKVVAQLVGVEARRKRIEPRTLRAVTDRMPRQIEPASDFIRRMRDGDRY
jgi:prevent-host-death family protein